MIENKPIEISCNLTTSKLQKRKAIKNKINWT